MDKLEDLLDAMRAEVKAINEIVAETDDFINRMTGPDNLHRLTEKPHLGSSGNPHSHKPESGASPRNTL